MLKSYGIYHVNETNLDGYLQVLNFCDLIKYSVLHYKTDVFEIELYESFLFELCVRYLKEYYLF